MSRRLLGPLGLAVALLLIPPTSLRADDESPEVAPPAVAPAPDAPERVPGPTDAAPALPAQDAIAPMEIARMMLLGSDLQQAFAAQYLERATKDTLLAVTAALRAMAHTVPAPEAEPVDPRDRGTTIPEGTTLVQIEVRILEIPNGVNWFKAHGMDALFDADVAFLSPEHVERIETALRGKTIRSVSAPRLSVFDGQRASISLINQISYVKDCSIQVAQDTFIADPIVDTVQEGTVMDVHPVLSADKRFVTVDFRSTWASLEKPMAERKVLVGEHPFTIQLPEVGLGTTHAQVTLPAGGTMLVRSAKAVDDEGTLRVALLRATPTELTALDAEDDLPGGAPGGRRRR